MTIRALAAGLLISAACLAAQAGSDARLESDLAAALLSLHESARRDTRQRAEALTSQLMAIPAGSHRPSRSAVSAFSRELARSLSRRPLPQAAATQLAAAIVTVLRGAGLPARALKEAVARFESVLIEAGAHAEAARSTAARLSTAGEEVRGPQDIPVIQ